MGNRAQIYLAGTLHLDRRNSPKLYRLMEEIRPAVITVEISRFSISFRKRAMQVWFAVLARNLKTISPRKRGHAAIRLMIRQLRMPWEWETASDFAAKNETRCIAVDTGEMARCELPAWHRELISPSNLNFLASGPDFDLDAYFAARRRAARLFTKPDSSCCQSRHPLTFLESPQWQRRERKMAERIGKTALICQPLLHICGWTHLITGSEWKSLADMLEPFSPEKQLVI